MSYLHPAIDEQPATHSPDPVKSRLAVQGEDAAVLVDVYREEHNIAIWRRELPGDLQIAVEAILARGRAFEVSRKVTVDSTKSCLDQVLRLPPGNSFSSDVVELVDMFCCLFDLKYAGLRLTALNRAMCPKFHVDNVPCRLVTTYRGLATQWLPHECVDRSRLGAGSRGRSDEGSGLYANPDDVRHLEHGDVALLKGELWEGNEGAGLIHRSPAVARGETRLLLTLDIAHQGR